LYLITFQALTGQTPGKWLCGIVVVDKTGKRASVSQILRRHLPDLLLGVGMMVTMLLFIQSNTILPEGSSRLSAFHYRAPWWDYLDDIWDVWIWSEVLLLCIDDQRRSLHEVISGTLVIHKRHQGDSPPVTDGDRSYADWILNRVSSKATSNQA